MTALVVVVVVLLAERIVSGFLAHRHQVALQREWSEERRHLLNRIEARSPADLVALENAGRPRLVKEPDERALHPGEHAVGL